MFVYILFKKHVRRLQCFRHYPKRFLFLESLKQSSKANIPLSFPPRPLPRRLKLSHRKIKWFQKVFPQVQPRDATTPAPAPDVGARDAGA